MEFAISIFAPVKKIFLSILIICYCISSYGVSINYFYCCGKLKTISLNQIPQKSTSCKANMGKDCCKYEKKLIKLKIDQKDLKKTQFNEVFFDIDSHHFKFNFVQNSYCTCSKKKKQYFQLPPPFYSYNLLDFYCIYRI